MMRIGLNATCFDDRPSGANQRFRLLYGAVIRRNPQHVFVIYEPRDQRVAAWFADCANVVVRVTPLPSTGRMARMAIGFWYWRRALRRDALDLFECFSLPLIVARCPTLVTIHDLRWHAAGTARDRWFARQVLTRAFRQAVQVIAVSDTIRREILAAYPATCVAVIHNGVDPTRFAGVVVPAVDTVDTADAGPFLLAVGHIERRKNLSVLIAAIALLRDRGVACPLVIAGRDGGELAAIRAQIAGCALGPLVRIVEDGDDAAVEALYAACALVVVPSTYEGFGIAVIEAMAARRAIVTSDIAVFRELTQGQGEYFAADDPAAAACAIDRLWRDPAARARAIAYGDLRVRDFSVARLADRIAALQVTSSSANAVASRPRAAS